MMLAQFENQGQKPVVSLIIPTLNEEKNLPLLLPYIPLDVVDEVILVDGRSKDHTVDVARSLLPSVRVILEDRKGKGAAMRRGYAESSGDILVVIDADGSHDPREIPRFVQALIEGADFVKGTRFAPAGGTTDMPRLRKAGNWGLTQMVNVLFAQNFTDLCYGFHAFWRHCLDRLELNDVDGFEIDTSIYLQAVRKRLKVVEVPSFEGGRFYGRGKLQTFPDGMRVLRTILKEWGASMRQSEPEPDLGFRTYQLSKLSMLSPFAVTSGHRVVPDGGGMNARKSQRMRYNLPDFLFSVLKNLPHEEREKLLGTILLEVVERLGASSGSLLMLDGNDHHGESVQVFGRTTRAVPAEVMTDMLENGIAGWAVHNQKPLVIPNTANEPRWLQRDWEQQENNSRSAVVIPFFHQGKPMGILILARPEDRRFTQEEIDRIESMEIFV